MRLRLKTWPCLLSLLLPGCVIPEGTKVVDGVKYPHEAVAFLDLPDATRDETVATLGRPIWESQDSRVLLYMYETWFAWHVAVPDSFSIEEDKNQDSKDDGGGKGKDKGKEKDKDKDKDKRPSYTIVANGSHEFEESTDLKRWGFFIAYDEKGLITGHQLCHIGDGPLEDECRNWANNHRKPH